MNKEYNIGLDIGTTSVGWAVVLKDNYKVMRKGNKALWGVRLFEEANTALERRGYRSTRRRYDRRRQRIKLLQEAFKADIEAVDPNFFFKLQESFYSEDKDPTHKKHPLTKEEKIKAKEYNEKFPTIYHLRNELITNPSKQDIRLVYLAIHHIIKYRGNFLYGANDFKVNNLDIKQKLKEVFSDLSQVCPELEFDEYYINQIDYQKLETICLIKSKNDRKKELKDYLNIFFGDYKKFADNFSKLVCGNSFSLKDMFHLDVEEDLKISFNGSDFDDKYDNIEKVLDNRISTLALMKEMYDMLFLKNLFGNRENCLISPLMVEKYLNHEQDLKDLKAIFNNNRKEYNKIFRSTEKYTCLYDLYIHNAKTYDDFVKELQKHIDNIVPTLTDSTLIEKLSNLAIKMNNGDLLPRITSTENGKYPYQINKEELKLIIQNQGKYYPFLLDMIDNEYKLVKLLSFKIPYYVGPLIDSDKHRFAWMKRKIPNVKITPYNFDEVVDKEKSAELFIERMLGHCTYLLEEPAMPNNSILYSEYKVLNELKQIRVNDQRLTIDFQHRLIDEFFRATPGTLTDKKFKEFLIKSREFDMYNGDISVTGYSAKEKFANNMGSYIDFFGPDGFFKDTNLTTDDAEVIIRWITIFEDKDILAKKIEKTYPILKPVLKNIIKKKYSGWSSLSNRLLTTPYYYDEATSTKKSIIDIMWETDENFMQIINNDKYGFQEMIAKINQSSENGKLNYQMVDELATSPSTKRGIWQALKIVEELVSYIGYEPSSISIEMARGDEAKQRKDDRKEYLNKLYTASKDSINEYKRLKGELDTNEINSEKMFLYFIQEGKSLYSGQPLDINCLDQYEVDHILPRTIIKNDSIDNKALVLREENQNKAASLVLPSEYRTYTNKKWWEHLKDINLISAKKLYNLKRSEFKNEDIEGFINRQLVETRQITKHVANILQSLHQNSKIIYLPAALSHNYREKFALYKFRDLNDFHHAHDAYLAAVLGEYKSHCNLKINFDDLKELTKKLIEEKKYNDLKYGYVINSIDSAFVHYNSKTGEVLDIDEFKKTVENHLYRNDILISKKTEIRTGQFYNQTKLKKGDKGVPLKKDLPTNIYGAYSSINPSYAISVKYTKRNKEDQRLIGIPIYIDKKDTEELNKYIRNLLNLSSDDKITIASKPIPFFSELNWNGQICYLVGATNMVEVCNAKELKLSKAETIEYKLMLDRLLNKHKKAIDDYLYIDKLKAFIKLLIHKVEKEYVLYQNLVENMKMMFLPTLEENKNLEIYEKLVTELLHLLKCNSTNANLKFLDASYSSAFGKRNERIIKNAVVINKSVTGLRTRKYEF